MRAAVIHLHSRCIAALAVALVLTVQASAPCMVLCSIRDTGPVNAAPPACHAQPDAAGDQSSCQVTDIGAGCCCAIDAQPGASPGASSPPISVILPNPVFAARAEAAVIPASEPSIRSALNSAATLGPPGTPLFIVYRSLTI